MSRLRLILPTIVLSTCVACAGARASSPETARSTGHLSEPGPEKAEATKKGAKLRAAVADTGLTEVQGDPTQEPSPTPSGPCAEYENRTRLSAEAHTERYGCPPCPCSCVNGELLCAPCAVCNPSEPIMEPIQAKQPRPLKAAPTP